MNEYDVIVCGGGPSGATTAFYAAKAGMKVLVIDKSKFPRDKACGGLLTARLFDELPRSEEHTSELQSRTNLVCRLLLEKKKNI